MERDRNESSGPSYHQTSTASEADVWEDDDSPDPPSTSTTSPTENPQIKVVVVGDPSVGKTSMVHRLMGKGFKNDLAATEFDNYRITVESENSPTGVLDMHIWDLGGIPGNTNSRRLCYENGTHNDIFLVCFSVINRDSFENVRRIWRREIVSYWDRNTSVILVGLQSEMRNHRFENGYIPAGVTPYDEAKLLTRKLSFSKYVECSAKMNWNVSRVFEEAARVFSVNETIEDMLLGGFEPPMEEEHEERAEETGLKARIIRGIRAILGRV